MSCWGRGRRGAPRAFPAPAWEKQSGPWVARTRPLQMRQPLLRAPRFPLCLHTTCAPTSAQTWLFNVESSWFACSRNVVNIKLGKPLLSNTLGAIALAIQGVEEHWLPQLRHMCVISRAGPCLPGHRPVPNPEPSYHSGALKRNLHNSAEAWRAGCQKHRSASCRHTSAWSPHTTARRAKLGPTTGIGPHDQF